MSKISEQKALEDYPVKELKDNFGTRDINRCMREACIQGYDLAMQDFMESACEWLDNFLYVEGYHDEEREDKIVDFKKYMEDEL